MGKDGRVGRLEKGRRRFLTFMSCIIAVVLDTGVTIFVYFVTRRALVNTRDASVIIPLRKSGIKFPPSLLATATECLSSGHGRPGPSSVLRPAVHTFVAAYNRPKDVGITTQNTISSV